MPARGLLCWWCHLAASLLRGYQTWGASGRSGQCAQEEQRLADGFGEASVAPSLLCLGIGLQQPHEVLGSHLI